MFVCVIRSDVLNERYGPSIGDDPRLLSRHDNKVSSWKHRSIYHKKKVCVCMVGSEREYSSVCEEARKNILEMEIK